MKTLLLTTPQTTTMKASVVQDMFPKKPAGWRVETRSSGSLEDATTAPDVTMVQVGTETEAAEIKALIPRLVHIQAKAPNRAFVLFSFKEEAKAKRHEMRAQKRRIQNAMAHINVALPAFPNPQLVNVTFAQSAVALEAELDHISAKLDLQGALPGVQMAKVSPRPSPLDEAKEVLRATEDLRVENGKLSAIAVAQVFGVSMSQLAAWLGRSRQAVNKTPDAESLQDALTFFERVARLRGVLLKEEFWKWLRMPNAQLDDRKPLELLASDEGQAVADLVEDMLTGAPI